MGHSGSHLKADLSLEYHHFLDILKEFADRPYLFHETDGLKAAVTKYSVMMDLQIDEASNPDVLWIWYLHLLHPESYAKDCTDAYGELIPFREVYETTCDKFDAGKKKDLQRLKARSYARHLHKKNNFQPSINLIQSAVRMGRFVVDGRRVWERVLGLDKEKKEDLALFETLSDKYHKFLKLAKKHPDMTLVPTFDISLAWHCHLRFPSYYRKDTTKLMGRVLGHGDESIDPDLSQTARLWEMEYGEKYELVADLFPPEPKKLSKKKQAKMEEEEKAKTDKIIQDQLELIEKKAKKERQEQEELKKQEEERIKLEAENEEKRRREIEGDEELPHDDEPLDEDAKDPDAPPPKKNSANGDDKSKNATKLIEKPAEEESAKGEEKEGKPKRSKKDKTATPSEILVPGEEPKEEPKKSDSEAPSDGKKKRKEKAKDEEQAKESQKDEPKAQETAEASPKPSKKESKPEDVTEAPEKSKRSKKVAEEPVEVKPKEETKPLSASADDTPKKSKRTEERKEKSETASPKSSKKTKSEDANGETPEPTSKRSKKKAHTEEEGTSSQEVQESTPKKKTKAK